MSPSASPLVRQSLRWRLLGLTALATALALVVAGVVLGRLFAQHVHTQFQSELQRHLDQLTVRLSTTPGGQPLVLGETLSDPRLQRPMGGLYAQAVLADAVAQDEAGLLWRSRSLWDQRLALPLESPSEQPGDGRVHVHTTQLLGQPVLALERVVRDADSPAARPVRLVVAGSTRALDEATHDFQQVLTASLAVLWALLALAAAVQVQVGLRPLRQLQQELGALQQGRAAQLQGGYPDEVQGLVRAFNEVLRAQRRALEQSRTLAGNLAHALKTPLTVLQQTAERARRQPVPDWDHVVSEQVALARAQVDRHLVRARAAAAHALPGQRTAVGPVLEGLLRLMAKVHADRALVGTFTLSAPDPCFAGEVQDLQEVLGNVLDNAFKWASSRVEVTVTQPQPAILLIVVDDDGPGIPEPQRQQALQRGTRLDEQVPGSGLGLAIVQEMVGLYQGSLTLTHAPQGGLRLELRLPAAH